MNITPTIIAWHRAGTGKVTLSLAWPAAVRGPDTVFWNKNRADGGYWARDGAASYSIQLAAAMAADIEQLVAEHPDDLLRSALTAQGWAPPTPEEPEVANVIAVPGTVFVTLDADDTVDHMAFTPAAGDAGSFGPKALLWLSGEDDAANRLRLDDTDGPFWRAVQEHLAPRDGVTNSIPWEE